MKAFADDILPLHQKKIVRLVQMKTFADDKKTKNVTQELKFELGNVKNIMGKGENAGYRHFLLFPPCFQKALSSELLKVEIVW